MVNLPVLKVIALTVAAVGFVVSSARLLQAAATDDRKPNVLFVGVDDLRPEMKCYGEGQLSTPNLDRLAQRGVRFDQAYCNIAVCGASRASLMKGLYPTSKRFTSYLTRADEDAPDAPSLALTFKNNGYHTVTNGKIYHHRGDDAAAWSEVDWRPSGGGLWWALEENRPSSQRSSPDGKKASRGPAYESADRPDHLYADHQIATKTIHDMRRLSKQDKPFFLACGFYRPHLPFVAPKSYWDLYPTHTIATPDNMYFPRDLDTAFRYRWGELRSYRGIPAQGPVSKATAVQLIRGYYACVSLIDAQVGRMLAELDELGLADNTIIVLWGDHGWQLGEHAMWCKHTNFQVAVRTPLMIVAPGHQGGRASQQLVEHIDLYPTLCDLAGLDKPTHLQGESLLPLLEDVNADHKQAIFSRYGGGDSIKTARYRYTEMRAQGGAGRFRAASLFDHEKDPDENQNVLNDPVYAQTVQQLKSRLDQHRVQSDK